MKRILAIAGIVLLGFLALPVASVLVPVTTTEAQACGTGGSSTMYKHCDKYYRQDWANGKFGNGGAMDPRGWNGGRRTVHGGYPAHYGRPVHYGQRQMVRRGPPIIVGGAPRVAAPVGVQGATFAQRYYAQFEQQKGLPPSPDEVLEMQRAAGNVTKVRVPCADGWTTLPNGNCGRWVPN